MMATDTSSLIAYINDESGQDVNLVAVKIAEGQLFLPPPVVAEFLSNPKLHKEIYQTILTIPMLDIFPDFWLRTAETRKKLLGKKLKSRLADAMIAQVCIDNNAPLITKDKDFRHYEKHCGLKLA